MTTQKHTESTKETKTVEEITPAGGVSDARTVENFLSMLNRDGKVVVHHEHKPVSYTEVALLTAIPTAIVVGGLVGMTAVLTVIDNRWGNGARANKLIDAGIERVSLRMRDGTEGSVGS